VDEGPALVVIGVCEFGLEDALPTSVVLAHLAKTADTAAEHPGRFAFPFHSALFPIVE